MDDQPLRGERERLKLSRLLLVSYAFPPLHVAMTPCVVKPMAALHRHGYDIDVVCAAAFLPWMAIDNSLLDYVEQHFANVERVTVNFESSRPVEKSGSVLAELTRRLIPKYFAARFSRYYTLLKALRYPDPMSVLERQTVEAIERLGADNYDAIISWSPYHSVNRAVARIKDRHPGITWIAQFSDPWANNPIDGRWTARLVDRWDETRTIAKADYLVYNSAATRALMAKNAGRRRLPPSKMIVHPFDKALYPQRPKLRSEKLLLRHIGVFFERRSPEILFVALAQLLARRPELQNLMQVEFIGTIEPQMLETPAAKALPAGLIVSRPSVSYVESLTLMYDADILLLVEANVSNNFFVPSKLSDYIGAGGPIVGMVPNGGARDILRRLGGWICDPGHPDEVTSALSSAIDYVLNGSETPWYDEQYRDTFASDRVAGEFAAVLSEIA